MINNWKKISKQKPQGIIAALKTESETKIYDKKVLSNLVKKQLNANTDVVASIKKGNLNAMQVIVGKVMGETKGKADARLTKDILEKLLKLRNH